MNEIGYILLATLATVNNKVLFPENAKDFKQIARKFVPETLANHISNLVYKLTATTEYPESEFTDESEDYRCTEQAEYTEIREKQSNGDQKIVKINLEELVKKVKERIIDDLEKGKIRPRVQREIKQRVHSEDGDHGIATSYENDEDKPPPQISVRALKNENMRPRPNQRLTPRDQNSRTVNKQPQTKNRYDYPEPESVPAPKLRKKVPQSDIFETTRLKSNKKKDSYEDYKMPPKEYDVYATEDDDKNEKQDIQNPVKQQGGFVEVFLGDETNKEPKRSPHNKRIQNKRPPATQGQEKGQFTGAFIGEETNNEPKRAPQNKIIQNKRPLNRPDRDGPERPLRNPIKPLNSNNRPIRPVKNKQELRKDGEEDGTPVRKERLPGKNNPFYDDGTYDQPINQPNLQGKKVQGNNNNKPMRENGQYYDNYDNGGAAQGNKAVEQVKYRDNAQDNKGNDPQADENEEYEKRVQNIKNNLQEQLAIQNQETTEYTEPTDVYEDEYPESTTPRDMKMRTETIGDEQDEVAQYNGESTTTRKKGTDIPTRHVFKMSTPDYYNKLPRVAEKYNFEEPIPEKDRIVKVTKEFVGPPAKINGRIQTAG